jgi:hypothetical protein
MLFLHGWCLIQGSTRQWNAKNIEVELRTATGWAQIINRLGYAAVLGCRQANSPIGRRET